MLNKTHKRKRIFFSELYGPWISVAYYMGHSDVKHTLLKKPDQRCKLIQCLNRFPVAWQLRFHTKASAVDRLGTREGTTAKRRSVAVVILPSFCSVEIYFPIQNGLWALPVVGRNKTMCKDLRAFNEHLSAMKIILRPVNHWASPWRAATREACLNFP